MKNIIFILLFPLFLIADYLVVDSSPVGSIGNGFIIINNISKSFEQNFIIGDNKHITEFPLYMNSDSNDKIQLKISNFSTLLNGEESIDVKLYYKNVNGSYKQIHDAEAITLQGNRDGKSIIGYIKIETEKISDTQTFGRYTLLDTINVRLGDKWSNNASFKIDADVSLVAVAGFTSTNSYKKGEEFISSTVKFNKLSFDINKIEQPLYVKSNSNNIFKITFNNTPDLLLDGIDNKNRIAMKYYYKKNSNNYHQIIAKRSFDVVNGKNSGSTPIGRLLFETEKIKETMLAGKYNTSISVSVYAQ